MSISSMLAAAGAAKRNRDKMFAAYQDNAPDYSQLAKEEVTQSALDNVNAASNNAKTADARIRAESVVRRTQIKADNEKDIRGIKKKARMTGMLAGGAAMLGIGAMQLNKKEEVDPTLGVLENQMGKYNERMTKANDDIATAKAEIDRLKSGKSSDTSTTETASVTTGSQPNTGAEQSGALSSLTDKDFDNLAFAVSSEAALGTDDEYGVAANIVTRLRSGKYGGSISEIINAPGQYEGVYKGMSKPSPEIAARFKTPEGRKKIEQFIKVLDGRTEFKGQTMLKNRVEAEDPMFDPKGNFYHRAGQ